MLLDARDPAASGVFRRLAPLVEAGEPCQRPEYVQRVAEVAGRKALVLVPDGEEAAACVTVRRIGPFRQVILPPFTPYSAAFAAAGATDALARAFESAFDEAILHLAPGDPFLGVASRRGWAVRTLRTYVLDPRVARDPTTWSQGTARNFRKGVAAHHVSIEPDGAALVASLAASAYERSGHAPPLPSGRFAPLAESVTGAGLGTPWICRNAAGSPVAGMIALTSGSRSSYWMAGSIPGDGMTVLLGSVFEAMAGEGIVHFDFVGANTPSIAEFKRRFGGRLVEYGCVRHTRSPWMAAARSIRRRVRREAS